MAKEYIERGDAFDAVMGQFCACSDETEEALNGAIEDIRKIPAADVAPVVRCKDCQYIAHFTDGHLECRLLADLRPIPCTYVTMKETDFCSYGKRRWELDADMREVQDDN